MHRKILIACALGWLVAGCAAEVGEPDTSSPVTQQPGVEQGAQTPAAELEIIPRELTPDVAPNIHEASEGETDANPGDKPQPDPWREKTTANDSPPGKPQPDPWRNGNGVRVNAGR